MSKANRYVLKAAKAVHGQSNLARKIGISKQFMGQIVKGTRPLPPTLCIPIERACDAAVTRYELRPDVFGSAADS